MATITNTITLAYQHNGNEYTTTASAAFERRNNMSCNSTCNSACNTCANFIKTTSVTLVGTVLRLNIPSTTLVNNQKICVCIAQPIPGTITPNTIVAVFNGATQITHATPSGNLIYADQVRSRKVLRLILATDIPSAVILNEKCLLPTAHVFPTLV